MGKEVQVPKEAIARLLERAAQRVREGELQNLHLSLIRSEDRLKVNLETGIAQKVQNTAKVSFSMSFSDLASNWPQEEILQIERSQV